MFLNNLIQYIAAGQLARTQSNEDVGDARQIVAGIFDIFQKHEDLKEDDLDSVLEKFKAVNVQVLI